MASTTPCGSSPSSSSSSEDENWEAFKAAAVSYDQVTSEAQKAASKRRGEKQARTTSAPPKQLPALRPSTGLDSPGPTATAGENASGQQAAGGHLEEEEDNTVFSAGLPPVMRDKVAALLESRLQTHLAFAPVGQSPGTGHATGPSKCPSLSAPGCDDVAGDMMRIFRRVKRGAPVVDRPAVQESPAGKTSRRNYAKSRRGIVKCSEAELAVLAVDGRNLLMAAQLKPLAKCKLPAPGIIIDDKRFVPYDERIDKLLNRRPMNVTIKQ